MREFGTGKYDSGPIWDQIYKVVTFFSTVDCYRGGKCIKVLGWIETLSEEQNIYFEV